MLVIDPERPASMIPEQLPDKPQTERDKKDIGRHVPEHSPRETTDRSVRLVGGFVLSGLAVRSFEHIDNSPPRIIIGYPALPMSMIEFDLCHPNSGIIPTP